MKTAIQLIESFQSHLEETSDSLQCAMEIVPLHLWILSMKDTETTRVIKHDCLLSLLSICSSFHDASHIDVGAAQSSHA